MSDDGMTEQEAAVYDRQIRLWESGVEAQRRMRKASILFCGFSALNAEVCKNLVLAGVSVTLLDNETVVKEDIDAHLFLQAGDIGEKRGKASLEKVRELNPLVTVDVAECSYKSLTLKYLQQYSVVCMTDHIPMEDQVRIDGICYENGIACYSVATFGFAAMLFADLGPKHLYMMKSISSENNPEGEPETVQVAHTMEFITLGKFLETKLADIQVKRKRQQVSLQFGNDMFAALLILNEIQRSKKETMDEAGIKDSLKLLLDGATTPINELVVVEIVASALGKYEISPVCAVMGGIVGQEIIKAISGNDEPINNLFCFNGLSGAGTVRKLNSSN